MYQNWWFGLKINHLAMATLVTVPALEVEDLWFETLP
jgi:hypothetical protein